MRFFIALEVPSENLAQFQSIQANLQAIIPQVRLTNVDKIHLTLAFIGEEPSELKHKLVVIMTDAASGILPFEVTPAYIDGFPNIHHAQVLWVGIKGDIDKIMLIRERIKDGLEALRLPVDKRRFVPHISIAKFNDLFSIDRNLESELEKIMSVSFNPITISSIKLFKSTPIDGLHKHNMLAEIKLTH